MITPSVRFRLSEDAAIHKRVLRVPASLLEFLLRDYPARERPAYRELSRRDLEHLDRQALPEGKRLLGLYVVLGPSGLVTEIGLTKARPVDLLN